ncbi:cupin domain-containing protein [Pseudomonas huanghezhanensis]|uniref:cupin domain-containing protein n=1 Tax=Pseudomonas huanghezhanensis TaxID=3002903 RepID=UPI002285D86C|nr:cupin domain-containing protein [Pseudomonas sp. BSw22131]
MSQPVVLLLARADHSPVDAPFVAGRLSADDPFAQGRKTAFIDDAGFAAGTVETTGSVSIANYPFTEMLVVHKGCVTITSGEHRVEIEPGRSAVIGRGSDVKVNAESGSLWAFCVATRATGADKPGVAPIDHRAVLAPSAAPEASILIGPTPQCRTNNLFEDTASTLRIGVWDSTPYARSARPHKVHELMHLIEGEVELKMDNGQSVLVKPGDTVFVPQGTPCAWTSTMYVRKFYAVS